ncbi:MAG: tetratricopeptide repeat protein, partial [Bacteroidota bacterium]
LLASAAILENGAHWKESQDLLEFYLGRNANSTYAWRLLGNARLNLGDTAQAIASYERTLEINPDYEKGRKALEQLTGTSEASNR